MRRILHKFSCSNWFLSVWGVRWFEVFKRNLGVFKHTLALLLSVYIYDIVFCSVRPSVDASAILLSGFPLSFEFLTARIVKSTVSITFVVFELPLIHLSIRPIELSISRLFATNPLPFVHGPVTPLEETMAVHLIEAKLALKDLSLGRDTSTVAVSHSICEVTLVDGSVGENLDALAIWFVRG